MKRFYLRNYSFLFLTQVAVGVNIVCFKYLSSLSVPTPFILFIRFFLAAVLLFLLHQLEPGSFISHLKKLNRKDYLYLVLQALTAGALFNGLMLLGLYYTDANEAGIITSALPAIIVLMCWICLKEQFSRRKILCVGLATIGLLIISGGKLLTKGSGAHTYITGDLLIFASLIPEAAYYVLSRIHQIKMPIFLLAALINGINALIFLPTLFFTKIDWHWILHLSSFTWLILLIAGMSSACFYVFWYMGSKGIDGGTASLFTGVMPVATVVIAWLSLGESITAIQLIGMGLVLASIFVYASGSHYRKEKIA